MGGLLKRLITTLIDIYQNYFKFLNFPGGMFEFYLRYLALIIYTYFFIINDQLMNYKTISRGVLTLILVVLVSSFTLDAPAKKFSPVGSWEYSVPGVQPGYETGTMIIAKDGKDYKITMELNEYFKADAEKVVYKKKTLSFTVWVETEEILVSGSFDGDNFSGKLSYFEGDFDITAVRKGAE